MIHACFNDFQKQDLNEQIRFFFRFFSNTHRVKSIPTGKKNTYTPIKIWLNGPDQGAYRSHTLASHQQVSGTILAAM